MEIKIKGKQIIIIIEKYILSYLDIENMIFPYLTFDKI